MGSKRKLGLGISLMGSSNFIFLDEATSGNYATKSHLDFLIGLDPISKHKIWDLLKALKDFGITFDS